MLGQRKLKVEIIKSLGIALTFLIVILVAIYILSGQIAKISRDVTQSRAAITILESKGQVAEELKKNFAAIGDGDKKIEEAFIEAKDIGKFIDELESIAKRNELEQNLRFNTPTPSETPLTPDQPVKELALTKVAYTISLNGDLISLNKYLQELEKAPYFSNITSMTIVSLPNATNWEEIRITSATVSIEAQLYLKQ